MPIVFCRQCQTKFYAKPNWIARGWGKFCSRKCSSLANRKGEIRNCEHCGQEVYKSRKEISRSKSKKLFCSKKCSLSWLAGQYKEDKHPNWLGGRSVYKTKYENNLEKQGLEPQCLRCQKIDKRILVVHHIDGNRSNNKLNNLTCLCRNCHFLVHIYETERKKLLDKL